MKEKSIISLHAAVKAVLHYYSSFSYPLKVNEIHFNCTMVCTLEDIRLILDQLHDLNKVHSYDKYYSINNEVEDLVRHRLEGEERAKKLLPLAEKYGQFIFQFPFVRFVGISGALSKGFAKREYDFDYFIITSKNSLWFCRTLLHLFKKLTFLFNLQHRFCMNYFIDEDHCSIEEQNLYTAIEVSSLKAVAGKGMYVKFLKDNAWRKNYLPNNYQAFFPSERIFDNSSLFKRAAEFIFGPIANSWNKVLMNWTDKKWRRKWTKKGFPAEEYDLAFKTTLYHSKNHPANYQQKLLSKLDELQKTSE